MRHKMRDTNRALSHPQDITNNVPSFVRQSLKKCQHSITNMIKIKISWICPVKCLFLNGLEAQWQMKPFNITTLEAPKFSGAIHCHFSHTLPFVLRTPSVQICRNNFSVMTVHQDCLRPIRCCYWSALKRTLSVIVGSLHAANLPPAIWTPKLANMNISKMSKVVTWNTESQLSALFHFSKRWEWMNLTEPEVPREFLWILCTTLPQHVWCAVPACKSAVVAWLGKSSSSVPANWFPHNVASKPNRLHLSKMSWYFVIFRIVMCWLATIINGMHINELILDKSRFHKPMDNNFAFFWTLNPYSTEYCCMSRNFLDSHIKALFSMKKSVNRLSPSEVYYYAVQG